MAAAEKHQRVGGERVPEPWDSPSAKNHFSANNLPNPSRISTKTPTFLVSTSKREEERGGEGFDLVLGGGERSPGVLELF